MFKFKFATASVYIYRFIYQKLKNDALTAPDILLTINCETNQHTFFLAEQIETRSFTTISITHTAVTTVCLT